MNGTSGGLWRISWPVPGLRTIGVVAAYLLFVLPLSSANAASPDALVKPDQYNVGLCESYFTQLKPGLVSGTSYNPQEQYTIDALCQARSADFSELREILASFGVVAEKTLKAEFVKAVVESNEFDAPGYDRISISGFAIEGDLNLSKITINNALELKNIQFLGNIDFSYSATTHNLDVSGTFPEAGGLCLKGFHTTGSVFIKLDEPPSRPPGKLFCTDTAASPSIGVEGARIEGELIIHDTGVGSINAEGAHIGGQVLIKDSTIFEAVDLSTATAGELLFWEVKAPGALSKDKACDSTNVFLEGTNLSESAEFVRSDLCGISMKGAHVSKNVAFIGSTLGFFDFTGATADGDLIIEPSFSRRLPVWLPTSSVQRADAGKRSKAVRPNLVLSHSSVNLLRVALNNWPTLCNFPNIDEPPSWNCKEQNGLEVGLCGDALPPKSENDHAPVRQLREWIFGYTKSLEDEDHPRPTIVADFKFKALARPSTCAFKKDELLDYVSEGGTISADDVEIWLDSTRYSPAEYQLIADLLTANGQSAEARRIGYVGKMIETQQDFQNGRPSFIVNLLSRWFIGYGYCLYLALFWTIVFCLAGAWVFATADPDTIRIDDGQVKPQEEKPSVLRKYLLGNLRVVMKYKEDYGTISPIAYSFDALLPIIRLRELHYQIDVGGRRHYYFYFQRIVGWILGIFVLAALSGITR